MENIIIRKVGIEDADIMRNFIIQATNETDFLASRYKPTHLTIEKEREFLTGYNNKKNAFMFVAIASDKAVGSVGITIRGEERHKHRGTIGISILKEYCGQGIGTKLIDTIINCARDNEVKKIELEVRVDNTRAIALYKKFGFEIEGEIRNAMCVDSVFYNEYIMGLKNR